MYLNKSEKVIILMKSEKITPNQTLTMKLQQIQSYYANFHWKNSAPFSQKNMAHLSHKYKVST